MANGRFSQPRPNRDEEREIEQAFRQLTGQAPAPTPDISDIPIPVPVEEDPFEIRFDDLTFENDIETAVPPVETPPVDFPTKAAQWLGQTLAFFAQNRPAVLVSLCAVALAVIVGFISIFFLSAADPYEKTILQNVVVADVNVGGMTKSEAVSAVKQATSHTYSSLDMLVDLAGTQLRLSPKDTGVTLDVKAAVEAAYDYGRTGTKTEKEQAYLNSLTQTHIIGLLPYLELNEDYIRSVLNEYNQNTGSTLTQVSYGLDGKIPDVKSDNFDPSTPAQTLVIIMGTPGIRFDNDYVYNQILDAYSLHRFQVVVENLDTSVEPDPVDLQVILDEFYIAPVNATVDLRNYEVTPGTYGYGFDMDAAQALIDQAKYGEEIRIPMQYLAPAVLDADMFFQDTLAEYETSYKDNGNLQTNLRLACEAINGTILNPGESFSFNTVVGQRTSAKGYKYADDCITMTKNSILGGGISQVSSALYYCALVADVEITNRTSHSLIPGFSDYGLDAAVGWQTPDFKFTNTLGLPIKIQASAGNGKVQTAILGTNERDYYVAMDYEITGTRPFKIQYQDFEPDNEEGFKDGDVVREGVNGYTIKTYRMKFDSHTKELISKDFVVTTRYENLTQIVARIVTKETTVPTEAPTTPPTEPPATNPTVPSTQPPTQAPTQGATQPPTVEATEASTQPPAETTAVTTTPPDATSGTE